MKITGILAILLFFLFSCRRQEQRVTSIKDYSAYIDTPCSLKESKLGILNENLEFWDRRLQNDSMDLVAKVQVASLMAKRFSYTGNINDLKSAESLYGQANLVNRHNSSSTFRSLAAVCITQHKFRLAKSFLDSALALGDDKRSTLLMVSDVALELGDHWLAKNALDKIADESSYEVLIRRAKYEDKVNGDLEKAIGILEKAASKYEVKRNMDLFNWTYSNLGDMYGHAGRYKRSYDAYLAVLKNDPEYFHCLKGIAWLAFSHDKDTKAAEDILKFLKARQSLPDYDLLLADIAAFKGNKDEEQNYLDVFQKKARDEKYGAMYNTYLCRLYTDWICRPADALGIAADEVKERPTPSSYLLLAWAWSVNGNIKKSLGIAKEYVEGHSFEPDAFYRLGMLYKSAGEFKKAAKYLSQAKQSSYELGPAIEKKIKEALEDLGT